MANRIKSNGIDRAHPGRRPLTAVLRPLGAIGLAALLSLVATSAQAGPGHGYRGYDGFGYGRHLDRTYHRGFRRGLRHGRRHSRSNRGAYLAGGVILGSVITHALTRPRYSERVVEYRSTTPVYQDRRVVVDQEPQRVSRRLFRDRDGNCYERETTPAGDDLLIELPDRDCDW
ncbi:MAG: hypothetical protein AAGI15_00145 [Pseudomonadota bacterium]